MWPIKTYLDIADDTYTRGMGLRLDERRGCSRLVVRDSNTFGKDYLLLKCSFNAFKHPEWGINGQELSAGIRLHKGQVKQLIRALQRFIDESEREEGGAK